MLYWKPVAFIAPACPMGTLIMQAWSAVGLQAARKWKLVITRMQTILCKWRWKVEARQDQMYCLKRLSSLDTQEQWTRLASSKAFILGSMGQVGGGNLSTRVEAFLDFIGDKTKHIRGKTNYKIGAGYHRSPLYESNATLKRVKFVTASNYSVARSVDL